MGSGADKWQANQETGYKSVMVQVLPYKVHFQYKTSEAEKDPALAQSRRCQKKSAGRTSHHLSADHLRTCTPTNTMLSDSQA